MPLRCLLFTGDEGVLRPVQQALVELGMDAEHRPDAAEAVIEAKTGDYQIVVADWNLAESAKLISAAKDRPNGVRPLILAVVSDVADTKAALRAGANSTLRRPLDPAQVRDTLDMARDLLRAKESAKAVAAAAGASAAGASFAPAVQEADMHLRAGEFLSNASVSPSAQFQVEAEAPIVSDHAEVPEAVKPLIELEPMAAEVGVADSILEVGHASVPVTPVRVVEAEAPPVKEKPRSLEELLQSRRQAAPVVAVKPKTGEVMGFGDMHGTGAAVAPAREKTVEIQAAAEPSVAEQHQAASEAALFSYISGAKEEEKEAGARFEARRWMRPAILVAALAMVVAMVAVKVPPQKWRQNFAMIYGAGHDWLNPPLQKPAEAPAGHENFGRAGDEYKLPAADPIPDATTDPSEIRVVPVVDPTAKTNSGSTPSSTPDPAAATATVPPTVTENSGDASKSAAPDAGTQQTPVNGSATVVAPAPDPHGEISTPATQRNLAAIAALQGKANATAPPPANQGIPSSLQSQIAPSDPAPGGVKPAEAALPAIEPVNLPEADARALLVQVVPPAYPHTVALNAQKGSVVVAVLLGRDGSVQDAKFVQGSLSFARSAIDAVRQWRFKPYTVNGRAVTVQTVLTLTFSPPA